MLTTAAGSIAPAKTFVMGAGVAGLQAIATARRLGAVVSAFDVRGAAGEQVRSLGAQFVEPAAKAEGTGGYARAQTDDETAQNATIIAAHISSQDLVITTALIPGSQGADSCDGRDARHNAARLCGGGYRRRIWRQR